MEDVLKEFEETKKNLRSKMEVLINDLPEKDKATAKMILSKLDSNPYQVSNDFNHMSLSE